ncbi:hypothetical protein PICMEDRAFT_107702 [Pichia membranifaciens NRRL Y-2026]|uniref:Uncharacterized protein n=1 Tax=Pichia membranifaciens NRRL Y-2026 TaxID=763406 RepID=A0A1E3NLZ9_9ASCO|nr:hypothetical protein PICMEDRAFT_107702 [Pichia membranifaciens NRRL Y-2026]ODQ47131.1 hypothetical protein PICMEDRAFT_107702 [Pichia membranifaciens NRRL Y-2026]
MHNPSAITRPYWAAFLEELAAAALSATHAILPRHSAPGRALLPRRRDRHSGRTTSPLSAISLNLFVHAPASPRQAVPLTPSSTSPAFGKTAFFFLPCFLPIATEKVGVLT